MCVIREWMTAFKTYGVFYELMIKNYKTKKKKKKVILEEWTTKHEYLCISNPSRFLDFTKLSWLITTWKVMLVPPFNGDF